MHSEVSLTPITKFQGCCSALNNVLCSVAEDACLLQHGRNCLQLATVHGHFETVLGILQTGLVDIDAVNKVSYS